MKKINLLILTCLFISVCYSQKTSDTKSDEHHKEIHSFKHHKIAIVTGYGFIPDVIDEEGEKLNRVIPVFGVDYEYWFNHKFGVGLHTDLELSSYTVVNDDQEHIARHYAFVISAVFLYEPLHNWALFAGPGRELEHDHSVNLFRIGTDYTKTFQDNWGVGIVLLHDFKEELVNSTTLGIVVSKRLGK